MINTLRKTLCLLLLVPFFVATQAAPKQPLIGISCGVSKGKTSLKLEYVEAVRQAGATPVLIPAMTDSLALRDLLSRLDGVILSGGEDVAPAYYGETPHEKLETVNDYRDTYDFMVAGIAHEMNLPMLGICRGVQLLNVYFGGTLYQDIPSQRPDWNLLHRARVKGDKPLHKVLIEPDSQLAKMFGVTEINANTSHHQAVKKVAPGFRIVARAADGTHEGIESIEGLPVWGVQFHPEGMYADGNSVALNVFKAFVQQTKRVNKKNQ